MEVIASLSALKDTSLPTILVIIGSIFLLLSFAGGVVGKISIPEKRQRFSGLVGGFMVLVGVSIYLAPNADNKERPSLGSMAAPAAQSKEVNLDTISPDTNLLKSNVPDSWKEKDGSFDNQWSIGEVHVGTITGSQTLANQIYNFTGNFQKSDWVWQLAPYSPSQDFYLGVDFLFRDTNKASTTGIVFRKTYKDFFVLSISQTKYVRLQYYDGSKWTPIFDWVWMPKLDLRQFNRLEVLAKGTDISIYMNKKKIQEVETDKQLSKSGNVGVYIESSEKDAAQVSVDFKNFEYIH